MSKQLFEVTLCTNTCIESFAADQLLRLQHSAHVASPSAAALPRPVVDLFLHHQVINRFDVRAVGRPHVETGEFGFLTTKQLHCLTTR